MSNWKDFDHYFKNQWSKEQWDNQFSKNEKCLDYLIKYIPKYVNSVIQFGCGNGRDFLPFRDNFYLYGVDLAPIGEIKWVDGLMPIYQSSKMQDWNDIDDLSNFVVYTQGTLMYLNPQEQDKFYNKLKSKGCKNFIFQEYHPDEVDIKRKGKKFDWGGDCFRLKKDDFLQKSYRQDNKNLLSFIQLDVDSKTKNEILNEVIV